MRRPASYDKVVWIGFSLASTCSRRPGTLLMESVVPENSFDLDALRSRMDAQRAFFATGRTHELAWRQEQLKKLLTALEQNETALFAALKADLGKPELEAYTAEIGFLYTDIRHTLKHLKRWMKGDRVFSPPALFPGMSHVQPDPLGLVLIIGAWNYPLQLLLSPMIAALAAGNCVVAKPSEISEHSSRLVARILRETFAPEVVTVVEGGPEETGLLLEQKFDHIFFTGSTRVGQLVMQAAARQLTPVTLELGGKSPCIVDATAKLEVAARRLVWGKFYNVGQTCVAPDYILVERRNKEALLGALQQAISEAFGSEPAQSPDYGRIIHERHFDRLIGMLQQGRVRVGGQHDRASRYLAPTVLDEVQEGSALLTEEIFGPLLPVVTYEGIDEAIQYVRSRPHPLALYLFSEDGLVQQKVLKFTTSGGACVNDCIVHVAVPDMPFGGVGASGIGSYHGKAGFETFSHRKSVFSNPTFLDVKLRYPPYGDHLKLIRRLM